MSIDLPDFDGHAPRNLYEHESSYRLIEYRIGDAELYLAETGLARVADLDVAYGTLLYDMAPMAKDGSVPEDFEEFSEGDYGKLYQNELETGALWTGKFDTLFVNFARGRRDKLSAFAIARGLPRRPVVAVEAMTNEDLAIYATTLQPATRHQRRLTAAKFTTTRLRQASK